MVRLITSKVFGSLPVFAFLVAGLACLLVSAGPAKACGYHNPADLARGAMNLAFPKSLYVRTAVWQAQLSGVLPREGRKAAKDLFAYQRTVAQLKELARLLRPSPGKQATFTVVLLDSMLWTHFVSGPDTYIAHVHEDGPQKGDAVLVSDSAVIAAFVEGRLDADTANRHGLFRLYGPPGRQTKVRSVLNGLSDANPASLGSLKDAPNK